MARQKALSRCEDEEESREGGDARRLVEESYLACPRTAIAITLKQCIFVMLQHRRRLQRSGAPLCVFQAPQFSHGEEECDFIELLTYM